MERVQSTKMALHKNHPNPLSSIKEQMRDRRFVLEYMRNGNNATKAAIAVGTPSGSARTKGSQLLAKQNIRLLIAEAQRALEAKTLLTVEDLLLELRGVVKASMQDYFALDEHGQPALDMSQLTPEQWKAISEITTETYWDGPKGNEREVRRVKFKLHDKLAAIEKCMRHLGAYAKDAGGGDVVSPDATNTVTYTLNIGNANIIVRKGEDAPAPKLIER